MQGIGDEKFMIDIFGRIRSKMSFRQFKEFMQKFAQNCYTVGLREGEDEGITFDEDELRDILVSEGVGIPTAERIIERIFAEGQKGLPKDRRKVFL